MASYTTNLNLKKPAGSENVAIGDINNNMDAIDTAYGTLNSKFAYYGKTLYTAQDTFTSGTITVPDLSKYFAFELTFTDTLTLIAFKTVDGTILWGGINIGAYNSNNIQTYACRYAVSGNDLTINASNRGYTNGTESNYSGLTAGLKRIIGLVPTPTQI